jgi:hypothetical protein
MALTDEQRAEVAKQAEVEYKTCLEMMEKGQSKSPSRSTNRKIKALQPNLNPNFPFIF